MYLLEVILLFLPAGLANMLPPIVALFLPQLSYPLDFYKTYHGKRIFGDHKTFRGLISGTLIGGLVFIFQKQLYISFDFYRSLSLIDYSTTSVLFGFLVGFGALFGDAIKSFIKRQVNIKPGVSWFPWDQIDWVIGSYLMSILFIPVSLSMALSYLSVGLALHLLIKGIGYLIKMNQTYI